MAKPWIDYADKDQPLTVEQDNAARIWAETQPGLDDKDFAKIIGVHPNTITNWKHNVQFLDAQRKYLRERSVQRAPAVLNAMYQSALKGDVQAQKELLRLAGVEDIKAITEDGRAPMRIEVISSVPRPEPEPDKVRAKEPWEDGYNAV